MVTIGVGAAATWDYHMAARKKVAKKKTARRKAAKRELIDTGTNKLYARRNKRGTSFKEAEDVGRSLAQDRAPEGQECGQARSRRPRGSPQMTPKVRRELGWLRTLAKTRRAAALKATQRRLMWGTAISKLKPISATK